VILKLHPAHNARIYLRLLRKQEGDDKLDEKGNCRFFPLQLTWQRTLRRYGRNTPDYIVSIERYFMQAPNAIQCTNFRKSPHSHSASPPFLYLVLCRACMNFLSSFLAFDRLSSRFGPCNNVTCPTYDLLALHFRDDNARLTEATPT
jgi:hypothetical protein